MLGERALVVAKATLVLGRERTEGDGKRRSDEGHPNDGHLNKKGDAVSPHEST